MAIFFERPSKPEVRHGKRFNRELSSFPSTIIMRLLFLRRESRKKQKSQNLSLSLRQSENRQNQVEKQTSRNVISSNASVSKSLLHILDSGGRSSDATKEKFVISWTSPGFLPSISESKSIDYSNTPEEVQISRSSLYRPFCPPKEERKTRRSSAYNRNSCNYQSRHSMSVYLNGSRESSG